MLALCTSTVPGPLRHSRELLNLGREMIVPGSPRAFSLCIESAKSVRGAVDLQWSCMKKLREGKTERER